MSSTSSDWFNIVLDREAQSYLAGEIVTGKLLCHNRKPKEIKCTLTFHFGGCYFTWQSFIFLGVSLTFEGSANVHWTEIKSRGRSTYTKHYNAHEVYFQETLVVFGTS